MINLSELQLELLAMQAQGTDISSCARELCISKSKAEKELLKARIKLGARNTKNAIYIAAKCSLICIVLAVLLNSSGENMRRRARVARRVKDCEIERVLPT